MKLRVATFNIRCSVAADGRLDWRHRRWRAVNLIRTAGADVIGFQEVWPDQLADLRSGMPGYAWIALDRGDGEMAAVAWRSDRWLLRAADARMLAPDGAAWGAKAWDAACPRMAIRVSIAEDQDGAPVVFANAHFDHEGRAARQGAAEVLGAWSSALGTLERRVVVGDLNARIDDPELGPLIASGLAPAGVPASPTFHGFARAEPPTSIDHILIGSGWRVQEFGTMADPEDHASDHDLVWADLDDAERSIPAASAAETP